MAAETVRVSEQLWQAATAAKRAEYRALAAEVRGEELFPRRALRRVVVDADDRTLTFALFEASGLPELVLVPRATLQVVLDEYASIIHRLEEEGPHTARAEALDHAKKVVHDVGARKLGEIAPELCGSLDLYRKVFSLIVAVVVGGPKIDWSAAH